MYRARRAVSQAPRMVGMRMCKHDRARMQALKFPEPIEAAIDHHIGAAIRDHQRSMHSMPSRPLLNLTARAEERQFHGGKFILFLTVTCDLFVEPAPARQHFGSDVRVPWARFGNVRRILNQETARSLVTDYSDRGGGNQRSVMKVTALKIAASS